MVPLGTPLLAGPGTIVATIVFTERTGDAPAYLSLFLALAGVHLVIWASLRYSGVLSRLLRPAGILLLTRVAGMLLAAIAVQMTADGVRALVEA
jgi:multiple antibiotic resistance protein